MVGIRLETGMALASLGLHAMFVAYLASYYSALSRPIESRIIVYPEQLLMVGIFLFAFPGVGMAFISYFLSKRDALKTTSALLITQGIVMPLGMIYALSLADNINTAYKLDQFIIVPQIFFIIGFIPLGLGIHIAKLKPVKRRYM